MANLKDAVYENNLYYTNPKGATLYTVCVVTPAEVEYIGSYSN